MSELTQERLRELLAYDPQTGAFTWRVARGNRIPAGRETGCVNKVGYKVIRIDGTLYAAHRLAFLHVTGSWPTETVDHVNGKRSDNRWNNLRLAEGAQNQWNMKRRADNKSGVKGVYFDKTRDRWVAKISARAKAIHVGVFATKGEAVIAVRAARQAVHGIFARDQ